MNTSPPARRCLEHNLAAGPDGRCTLCHRPAVPAIAQAAEPQPRISTWLSAIGLVVSIAGVGWVALERQQAAPAQAVMEVVSPVDPMPQKRMAAEPPPKAEASAKAAASDEPTEPTEPAEDTQTERERAHCAFRVPSLRESSRGANASMSRIVGGTKRCSATWRGCR
jgi:hypothetical protein